MDKTRLNVGLFISEYSDRFAHDVCVGAMSAAEEADLNLFIFAGGYFDAPYMDKNKSKAEYQNNYLYNFATKKNIDVLVILLGTIASNVSVEVQKEFLDQFSDIPIITIANKADGYSNISFDNKSGFAKSIEYLITSLNKTKIGIVCGPATNRDSIERLEAYKETLKAHNLPVLDKRITYGNFTDSSDEVIENLLNENPDLDAIAFENDYMAISGYRVMKERGIQVGRDIAVIGFDDAPESELMNPGLTTTKANSSELGYRAILEATKLSVGDEKDIRVNTSFIVRKSCGSSIDKLVDSIENKFIFNPEKDEAVVLVNQINDILFKKYIHRANIEIIEKEMERFVSWLQKNVYKKRITDELYIEFIARIKNLTDHLTLEIDDITFIYEIAEYLLMLMAKSIDERSEQLKIYAALAEWYKYVIVTYERRRSDVTRRRNALNQVSMAITRDMINVDNSSDSYEVLLSKLYQLDIERSYLCLYPQTIKCVKDGEWEKPEKLCISVYQDNKECFIPNELEQNINVDDIFTPSLYNGEKRQTLALSMLFSNDEQYGIFVTTLTPDIIHDIESISYQISSAIKTMGLLNNKEIMAQKLEDSLSELKETNAFLDEVSKSDELTQIYNRRGFLATARRYIRDPRNLNKRAIVLYADMNNLKLINDKFGHEEGDYALKTIAQILVDALGEKEIIGRFGGDEFAAFLFMDDKGYEQIIRNKITESTIKINDNNDKPYYISMSVGISAFDNTSDAELNDAMVRADVDLYLQKKHKRNKILK